MSADDPPLQSITDIGARIDQLLDLVRRLTEENRSLRQSQEQLSAERAGLIARNEQARSRVEAMIGLRQRPIWTANCGNCGSRIVAVRSTASRCWPA